MHDREALVVLSGGQDSTTCLFWATHTFKAVHAITFDYGQRHSAEIEAAMIVAKMAGVVSHKVITIPPGQLESVSPLTSDALLEKYENAEQMAKVIGDRVEVTFVPMRNTLFLTIAANRAVNLGVVDIVTGVCQADNANYPDCTEAFIFAIERAIKRGLGNYHMKIHAPLLHYTKADTCKMAMRFDGCYEALAWTHTSYDGKYPPTDMNHANVLRAAGFEEAGLPDPLVLRAWRDGLMALPTTDNYDPDKCDLP